MTPFNNVGNNKCELQHEWNGERPKVNPDKHEIQFPELYGKQCDCGQVIWFEELCGCAIKKWEARPLPNPNR